MFVIIVSYKLYTLFVYVYFFFFKQKTAYEMRISDWSSDVCSSDLPAGAQRHDRGGACRRGREGLRHRRVGGERPGDPDGEGDQRHPRAYRRDRKSVV